MDTGTYFPVDDRVERIRLLARKLEDSTVLTTAMARARCGKLALEILELLNEGDAQNASAISAT